ncbi:hypothetical protein VL15_37860 [Burkholderia cepacia]|uniref:Uncharacterized protein n=1 Tax=Burkholderia cepacia TaxID=292 RepID=A0A0J5W4R6_BURCE|nr:hypothetical protein VL15_37860 [Burkholderia cepacia]
MIIYERDNRHGSVVRTHRRCIFIAQQVRQPGQYLMLHKLALCRGLLLLQILIGRHQKRRMLRKVKGYRFTDAFHVKIISHQFLTVIAH